MKKITKLLVLTIVVLTLATSCKTSHKVSCEAYSQIDYVSDSLYCQK
jgi:hypothetical protein